MGPCVLNHWPGPGPHSPQPGCCGAGDWLTPICSRWEPHCSGAVYCIRGMLSSNQLSGRPSPDLIPTLAGLWACSAFMWGWQGRTRQCSPWPNPSCWRWCLCCHSGSGLARVSPGVLAGGLCLEGHCPGGGAAWARVTPVQEEVTGLVWGWAGGSSSRLPSQQQVLAPRGAQVLLWVLVLRSRALMPPCCVCRTRNVRWPLAYGSCCSWLPASCRKKGR